MAWPVCSWHSWTLSGAWKLPYIPALQLLSTHGTVTPCFGIVVASSHRLIGPLLIAFVGYNPVLSDCLVDTMQTRHKLLLLITREREGR